MTIYSLLYITEDETIARSRHLVCRTDEQALQAARRETEDHRVVEVWAADRSLRLVEKHERYGAQHP